MLELICFQSAERLALLCTRSGFRRMEALTSSMEDGNANVRPPAGLWQEADFGILLSEMRLQSPSVFGFLKVLSLRRRL